ARAIRRQTCCAGWRRPDSRSQAPLGNAWHEAPLRLGNADEKRSFSPCVPKRSLGTRSMKLAVFLPKWICDAVMATPALRALRRHFGGDHLLGVLKPYVAGVLEGGDWFDEIIPHNGGPWSQGVVATARRLRCRHIDLAILFPNSFRSALTA